LIRLPRTAWCFSAPANDVPLVRQSVGDSKQITFGCFNNLSKITPEILELWAQILQQTPGSKLLIKAKALACDMVARRIQQIMESAGVPAKRLELQSWQNSYGDHLTSYHRVDIALDTFPYHGTTTTSEALWMGVAVVTLAGATHVSRVGVSLLSNVGLPELIADGSQQYVRLAVDLAKDTNRLNQLRLSLRERMRASPLMDGAAFAREMEMAYRRAWQHWCRS